MAPPPDRSRPRGGAPSTIQGRAALPGYILGAVTLLAAFLFPFGPPAPIGFAIIAAIGLAILWLSNRLHRAEKAQREAVSTATMRAERLDAILNTSVDGIIVIDATGTVEAFNPGAERLFGYSKSDVVGHNVSMLMSPPQRDEHDGYLRRYLETGHARIIGTGREVAGRRKDGSTFPLHLSVGELTIDGARKFTGILHDLSARVQMEEQLREQAALARLGEMAAVIAHEVKNPLAGIRGAVQIFGSRIEADATTAQVLTEIVSRIDSLDLMMKDLLLFARPPKPRPVPSDVVPLLTATVGLLSQDPAFRGVDVQVEGTAPPVPVDADMLRIVFQNLLINGAHAMHGKGRIRVTVRTIDGTCTIAFSDGGPGIPAGIREKIFTPFFTTKSRGSGLGLPTAKRLVEAHHGSLAIDCPPSGGTTVVVTLPFAAS